MKAFNNQKGFGLIEVLIGVGILGISGLAMMQLLDQNLQSSHAIEGRIGKLGLAQDIRTELSRANLCRAAIAANPANVYQAGADGKINLTLTFANGLQIPSPEVRDSYQVTTTRMYFEPDLGTEVNLSGGRVEIIGDLMFDSEGKTASRIQHVPTVAGRLIMRYQGTDIVDCGLDNSLAFPQDCAVPPTFGTSALGSCVNPAATGGANTVGELVAEGTHYTCDQGANETNHICINSVWVNLNYVKPTVVEPVVPIPPVAVVTPPPAQPVIPPPVPSPPPVASYPSMPNPACSGGDHDPAACTSGDWDTYNNPPVINGDGQ